VLLRIATYGFETVFTAPAFEDLKRACLGSYLNCTDCHTSLQGWFLVDTKITFLVIPGANQTTRTPSKTNSAVLASLHGYGPKVSSSWTFSTSNYHPLQMGRAEKKFSRVNFLASALPIYGPHGSDDPIPATRAREAAAIPQVRRRFSI